MIEELFSLASAQCQSLRGQATMLVQHSTAPLGLGVPAANVFVSPSVIGQPYSQHISPTTARGERLTPRGPRIAVDHPQGRERLGQET